MSTERFIRTLLIYFAKYGIKEINIKELAKKLYPYTLKQEYKSLFANSSIKEEDKEVDILKSLISEGKKGHISITDGKLSINPIMSNLDNEDQLELINQIAREIVYRHTFEKSYFNIYGLNPNQEYICYHNGFYSASLYTDGVVTKTYEEIIGSPKEKILYFFHQTQCGKKMKLKVANASYAALVDYSPNHTLFKLYTQILDREKLEALKKSLMQDESEELLKDKSVQVRKLKI